MTGILSLSGLNLSSALSLKKTPNTIMFNI